jgi:galactokinase
MDKIVAALIAKFRALYDDEPLLFRSPGRINLIGEHVDYNNGIVLPAAIDRYIYIALQNREDDEVHLYSLDYEESFQCLITELKPSDTLWANYILGVADQFQKSGITIHGFNLVFSGNIPQGAGLSSSAALECATAFGLQTTNKLQFSRMELANIAQSAENDFVGVNCGLMDQFASLFGKEEFLVEFDCQSLDYRYLPFKSDEYEFILFDTQVKHSLASSAYNERRLQCEAGVELMARHHPEIESLRQATMELLEKHVKMKEPLIFRRCSFIVNEIQRVKDAVDCIINKDFKKLGQLMFETHSGLSEDYEVSCPELDFLIERVKQDQAVLGARMMGGGFGGCTINLIRKEEIERVIDHVSHSYKIKFGIDLPVYKLKLSESTEQLINHRT